MIRTSLFVVALFLALPSHSAQAADFYVDPLHGDMANDGSSQRPWKSLQAVFDKGLVESRKCAKLPFKEGAVFETKNPGAPVRPGDTIHLRSGSYGAFEIRGYYNPDWITLAADEGHKPEFTKILIRAGSCWKLRGLFVCPDSDAEGKAGTLIDLQSHGFHGPVRDMVVEDCHGQSIADSSSWTLPDWNTRAWNGIEVDGKNMTVRNCTFRNVNFGISVGASDSMIEHNTVENFAGDGLRGLGDNTTFQYNTVKNCYDVNGNHDDGFQSWSTGDNRRVGRGEVRGIVLRGNTIINFEDPQQPFRGTLQGIGCFDGMFVDWVVENNVILTDHYHGITLLGAKNCRIVNNTVLDLKEGRPGPPWIRIGNHKNKTPSSECVIRNNLATGVGAGEGVTADHNLIVKDPSDFFVDAAARDVHLKPGCEAIDAGTLELAPLEDAAGTPRPQGKGIDVGAYEYRPGKDSSAE